MHNSLSVCRRKPGGRLTSDSQNLFRIQGASFIDTSLQRLPWNNELRSMRRAISRRIDRALNFSAS